MHRFIFSIRLTEEVEFDRAFTFKYSTRPPARVSELKDDVSTEEKERRLKVLMDLQYEISKRRNETLSDIIVEMLVDSQLPAMCSVALLNALNYIKETYNITTDKNEIIYILYAFA